MSISITSIREGKALTLGQQISLTMTLAFPAMLAQISSIAMQYIDAAMVGKLGANDSAAIGLVSTSLWLFWGTCSSITSGFSVQIAHRIGAKDNTGARKVLRQGIVACLIFGIVAMLIGVGISQQLPHWLGGDKTICHQASLYFLVFVLALPILTLNYLAGAVLRCAGNMKIPSIINIVMCVLDCVFNFILIFPSHHLAIGGISIIIPGAGLGVLGAALGTVIAEIISALLMLYFMLFRQPEVRLHKATGSYRPTSEIINKAIRISAPMGIEHIVICGAQIAVTMIVAPLGVCAIAANAFAVIAESLCYMPGYGIGEAATTLVGQSYGAARFNLVKRFGYISVSLGVLIMSAMGILMYVAAPVVMKLFSPVSEIQQLGIEILRIEAWAEPMFAASIVAYGVFVGVGSTIIPAVMNFGSIWIVRLPLAWWLSKTMGLQGVWMAMCIELIFRGTIFLIHMSRRWIPAPHATDSAKSDSCA